MISIICPGQGSQKAGMLEPWLNINENLKLIKKISTEFDFDFIYYGCQADENEILNTSIAQPLIFINSYLSFKTLEKEKILTSQVSFLGHSVGELAALVIGNFITLEDGLKLVITRGLLMEKATMSVEPTGMMAVIFNQFDSIKSTIEDHNLFIANYNSNNQIVVAGYKKDLIKYQNLIEPGVKKIILDVQGAFHTPLMQSAVSEFKFIFEKIRIKIENKKFISNSDGRIVKSEMDLKLKLVNQIISPVRWDLCMKYIFENKIHSILELSPSGVLSNLFKRDYPSIKRFSLNQENIEDANNFLKENTLHE